MKKVFLIGNHDIVIYNFRNELIMRLLQEGYQVGVVLPYGEKVELLKQEGCTYYEAKVDRRGMNICRDLGLLWKYWKILKKEKPDIVLTYTIKPNIYGSLAAGFLGIPCIVNITGLGSAVENSGVLQRVSLFLYHIALKKVKYLFFQNQANMDFFMSRNIFRGNYELLPGSGVNTEEYAFGEFPKGITKFVFVGRLMREKGIEEYLYAAQKIRRKYGDVEFHICGFCEEEYQSRVEKLQQNHTVIYHGMVQDMKAVYKEMSCIVLPSYHEGMSNVLLEAAAMGRPGIASRIPGCEEIVEHERTGYLFERKNNRQLCKMMEKFLQLSHEERAVMGREARRKIEKDFDRNVIVKKYLDVIKEFSK